MTSPSQGKMGMGCAMASVRASEMEDLQMGMAGSLSRQHIFLDAKRRAGMYAPALCWLSSTQSQDT